MTTSLQNHPLRSPLFCPGSDERKIRKALASEADVVILDLEDSVEPSAKEAARTLVASILNEPRRRPIAVRVNASDTSFHLADLARVIQAKPDAVMLAKCSGARDLSLLADRMDVLEVAFGLELGAIGLLPLVTETAGSVADLDYRNVKSRLVALCFAAEDLAADLGVKARANGQMNPLLIRALHAVAFAAAAAGVPAVDTPFPDPRDSEGLMREARAAAELGFAGKLCIHPGQIVPVHDSFRPEPERIAWARAVIGELEGAARGVGLVDGAMVDGAHLRLARRYLAMAGGEESRR